MPPSKLTLKFSLDLTTSRRVQAAIHGVLESVKNRVLKQSIAKVARAGAKHAKSRAPVGYSGLLKASIGTKYKSYQRGLVWVYVIGPRKSFVGVTPGVGPKGSVVMKKHVPYKIAHFGESGVSVAGRQRAHQKLAGRAAAFVGMKPRSNAKRPQKRKIGRVVFTRKVIAPYQGKHFTESAYGFIKTLRQSAIQDVLAGIQREAAKYAAKGKSIYA